jgi:hypothetical protein
MKRGRFPIAADDDMSDADIAIHQADRRSESVTPVRERNRERKRLQRQRQSPIVYERDDWQLFIDPATLPQKAGCQPDDLPALVLKELVDNALDAGARVTLDHDGAQWIVSDDGPGIGPQQVPELFAVNRPLRSSKLKRLPTRGMLGNGLRVVMAWARELTVETRGVRLTLALDDATGHTTVKRCERIAETPGLTVIVPSDDADADYLARLTLQLAGRGTVYDGPSLPHWYGRQDMARLLQAAPAYTTAAAVIRDLGLIPPVSLGARLAHQIDSDGNAAALREMQGQIKPIKPEAIGKVGNYAAHHGYAFHAGIAIEPAGGHVPYVIEAAVQCELSERRGVGHARYHLTLNRSATVARLHGTSYPDYLSIEGCGLGIAVRAPTGDYSVWLSLITPHLQLTSDGKSPSLAAYKDAIVDVLYKAARQAHARAARPARSMSIKDAAWDVMEAAYLAASANNTLPANARQIMYAARGDILRLTGKETLNDHYFTQTLLPDYIEAHPEETADWDVVFDDRGAFVEPHTGRVVPLGTIAVREYLGERQRPEKAATINPGSLAATVGPQHRYRDVLFIEKEGFTPLLDRAQLAELFDLGIMSTKGLSVTAARMLIDGLTRAGVERVFVLHDFDVSGFSIFGTLGTSSRRYRFENTVQIVDLGLRLTDIEAMGLEWEPYSPGGDWDKRADTLARHGATEAEIDRLRDERVELNAMPSDAFVQFLTGKLTEHGVRKLVPDQAALDQHFRRVITRALLNQELAAIRSKVEAGANAVALPADLHPRVEALLLREPSVPWDIAVARIARQTVGKDDDT